MSEEKEKKVLEMWEKEQLANECVRQFLKYKEVKEYLDEYKSRINKAIEYANINMERFGVWNYLVKKMINILEGKDNG